MQVPSFCCSVSLTSSCQKLSSLVVVGGESKRDDELAAAHLQPLLSRAERGTPRPVESAAAAAAAAAAPSEGLPRAVETTFPLSP